MDEVDVEPESEASSKDNMKYSTHNLQIDFQQKESVAHNDDTSKAAVNDADDFANFHQPVNVISVDPMLMIVDEQEKMISLIVDVSTNSAISQPCYDILSSAKFLPHQVSVDPLADTIETSHFMSFNQPLSHYVLLTGKDFQPLSQICELPPPPPKPPDGVGVVTPMSPLNLSLLVTTAKHFSILQTSLQLFDEMPECHKTVWSANINRCMDNEQVLAYVEMLHLCASNFGNCVESDPKKNFLIEEIMVLEEAKWIGLPNFMPRAAFLYLLQRKLGVSTRRAGEELIAKKKNSIQHVMEVDECGKAKVHKYGLVSMSSRHIKKFKLSLETLIRVPNYQIMKVIEPLLDGVCIEVPKVLAPGPQLVHTWGYSRDLFHDDCSSVLANIYCYFVDSAMIRRFDFVSKASGIKHTIGELFYDNLIFQRSEAKRVRFYVLEFLVFLVAILGSSVGTHELVKINDDKNMEVPNIYRQMDGWKSNSFNISTNETYCSISLVQGVHLVIAHDALNNFEITSQFGSHQYFSTAKLVQLF
ncbi:unnamed protein product [Trifolium pratense]|uniref:Uncharacterized protein n=1 Tax=Trifolium pratense TaxID=57577 RepID=A0ACB0JGG4_TRIPR|nr:unnamed protein product [Trifolium pratense]